MWSPRLKSSQKSVTMVLSTPSLPSHKTISNVDYATEDHHHISKKKRRLQTIPHQQTGSQEITDYSLTIGFLLQYAQALQDRAIFFIVGDGNSTIFVF